MTGWVWLATETKLCVTGHGFSASWWWKSQCNPVQNDSKATFAASCNYSPFIYLFCLHCSFSSKCAGNPAENVNKFGEIGLNIFVIWDILTNVSNNWAMSLGLTQHTTLNSSYRKHLWNSPVEDLRYSFILGNRINIGKGARKYSIIFCNHVSCRHSSHSSLNLVSMTRYIKH